MTSFGEHSLDLPTAHHVISPVATWCLGRGRGRFLGGAGAPPAACPPRSALGSVVAIEMDGGNNARPQTKPTRPTKNCVLTSEAARREKALFSLPLPVASCRLPVAIHTHARSPVWILEIFTTTKTRLLLHTILIAVSKSPDSCSTPSLGENIMSVIAMARDIECFF